MLASLVVPLRAIPSSQGMRVGFCIFSSFQKFNSIKLIQENSSKVDSSAVRSELLAFLETDCKDLSVGRFQISEN